MLAKNTIDKLIEMRLTTMADAFRNQLDDPKFKEVPFEDRLGMLVDIEYSNCKNNRQKRLIRNAGFDQPEANIMDINYTSGRKLNKDLINRLATCEYISELQIPLHRITDSASNGSVFPVVTEHFSASSDHAFL